MTMVIAHTGQCPRRCPGARRCILDGAVRHTLCVCADERCYCHSRERMDAEIRDWRLKHAAGMFFYVNDPMEVV